MAANTVFYLPGEFLSEKLIFSEAFADILRQTYP
jgi:hypothetical protein